VGRSLMKSLRYALRKAANINVSQPDCGETSAQIVVRFNYPCNQWGSRESVEDEITTKLLECLRPVGDDQIEVESLEDNYSM
jgi:hypothetical protein